MVKEETRLRRKKSNQQLARVDAYTDFLPLAVMTFLL